MKTILYILSLLTICALNSCHSYEEGDTHAHESEGQTDDHNKEEVHLSASQMSALDLKIAPLSLKSMTGIVEANGRLEVPPQNEATVTATLGGNVTNIFVIEGDHVEKGQQLATLRHPDITRLQTDYIESWNHLSYLGKEYDRQKKLYNAGVGAGKDYEKTKAEYDALKGAVKGLESQLNQLGIAVGRLRRGDLYQSVPLRSPIEGYVERVSVKIGQYVAPNIELFSLVNIHHIHADIMVFEKDIQKVEEGQIVRFKTETMPDTELEAKIYSVGKTFEQNPKAVHVHAEIKNKEGKLIPGMYIKAKIIVNEEKVLAIPEDGVFSEDNEDFIFTATEEEGEWSFKPIKVKRGLRYDGWVEVDPLKPIREDTQVAHNSAYYLISEMKKGEAEHSH